MSGQVVLNTTARIHEQVLQEELSSREAMNIVRDWIAEQFDGIGNVGSWTPYWKEIIVRRPGNILAGFRFRLGGPVELSRSYGWKVSPAEVSKLEAALLPFLDELGRAMAQRRIANGIQSQYPDATRHVRDDDTLLMQVKVSKIASQSDKRESCPLDLAAMIRPDLSIKIFARCDDEKQGRTAVRRFIADIQVAGLPIAESRPILVHSSTTGN